jgi:hypothetical protein
MEHYPNNAWLRETKTFRGKPDPVTICSKETPRTLAKTDPEKQVLKEKTKDRGKKGKRKEKHGKMWANK